MTKRLPPVERPNHVLCPMEHNLSPMFAETCADMQYALCRDDFFSHRRCKYSCPFFAAPALLHDRDRLIRVVQDLEAERRARLRGNFTQHRACRAKEVEPSDSDLIAIEKGVSAE